MILKMELRPRREGGGGEWGHSNTCVVHMYDQRGLCFETEHDS